MRSIRVCRGVTRHSLGYAYVNFEHHADAKMALDILNFDLINGRPMRIMWLQRNPYLRKFGNSNLFIKNLHKSVESKSLYKIFSSFGTILSSKVAVDECGESKGYAFVHYECVSSANAAIRSLNNVAISGQKVHVCKLIRRSTREQIINEKKNSEFCNVYIKNLGDKLTGKELYQMCLPFGKITSYKLMTDKKGKSKGFGFVAFQFPSSANNAIINLNGKIIDKKPLYACKAKKLDERKIELKKMNLDKRKRVSSTDARNLFIRNLDDVIDDDFLRNEFSLYGTITRAKVMTEDGRSKGFGFVSFSLPEEATIAAIEMNGRILVTKPIYVAIAQRREEREALLVSQYMQRVASGQCATCRCQNKRPSVNPCNPSSESCPTPNKTSCTEDNGTQISSANLSQPNSSTVSRKIENQQPITAYPSQEMAAVLSTGITTQLVAAREGLSNSVSRASVSCNNYALTVNEQQISSCKNDHINRVDEAPASTSAFDDQKQKIGVQLYPLVYEHHPTMCGKITGMMLEMDNTTLLRLLKDKSALRRCMDEAKTVYVNDLAEKRLNKSRC